MCQKTFLLTAGVVFLLIALGHLLRVVLGATFIVKDVAVPIWASAVAVVIAGYLAFQGFRLSSKSQ